ncbi:MAG: hypothetical protein FWC41_11305, partial [Firmicutes bacterium]|nr:hypothetical protein [Bacillota bacterium]
PGLAIPSKTPGMKDLVEETKDFKIKAGVLTIKGKFKVKVTDAASNFLRAKDFLIEFIDDTIWLMTEDEKEEIDTEVNKAKDATPEEKEKIEDSLADKLVAEPIKIPGLAKFINAKPEPTM